MTLRERAVSWISLGLAVLVLVSGVLTFSIPALAMGAVLLIMAQLLNSVVGRMAVIQSSAELTAYFQQRRASEGANDSAGAHD